MQRLLPISFLLFTSLAWASSDTVAVLPFFNTSGVAGFDWMSESIAQTTHDALVAEGLLVLNRDDVQEAGRRLSLRQNARLTHASVIKVAEALDATDIVFGEFSFTPPVPGAPAGSRGSLHITAWVLNMRRMRKGPDFMESGQLDDLAQLQSHLAWQVLRYISPENAPTAEDFLKERPPVRLDAMENYTRGLLATSPEQKHRYFTQAARLDERFVEADFQLGRLYFSQKEYKLAAERFQRVKSPAPRALEATFLLGLCRYYAGDFSAAQQAFEQVADAVPLNEVFNNLGVAQSRRNQPDAAESFRKAIEGDSADPDYHFNLGVALWKAGKFTEAADSFRAVLDRKPDDTQATLLLGRCLKGTTARPADLKAPYERVKLNYEEGVWRQLKAAIEGAKSRER